MTSTDTSAKNTPKRATTAGPTQRRSRPGRPEVGRYDGRSQNTRLLSEGMGKPPKSRNTAAEHLAVAAVPDPWGDGRERVYATVNRRVDILEDERSHKLITEAAYRVGRQVQQVFELAARIGGSNWAGDSRSDPLHTQRSAIARAMERAEEITAMERRIRERLGEIDMRLLRRVLRDRMSFADCAALVGKAGAWGERYIKARFRHALEDLAEAWMAKGKAQPSPDDKHQAAARGAGARQASSIGSGVSARRVATEKAEEEASALKAGAPLPRRVPGPRTRR